MKHPYLCAGLTIALSFTAVHSGIRLNAAELWNSTGTGSSPSGVYYNTTKDSAINRSTLYNVTDSSVLDSRRGGLESVVEAYKNVKIGDQRRSKQYSFMSADAVANRQADTDHALQLAYDRQKATAKHMIEVYKKSEKQHAQSMKKYQEKVAAFEAMKEEKELERQRKKDYALGRIKGNYTTSKSSYSASSSTGSTGYTARPSTSVNTTVLEKPARLFNDPND